MKPLRIWLVGFGTVGQWLARALDSQARRLAARYDIAVTVVGLASARGGFVYHPDGLDLRSALGLAAEGRSMQELPCVASWSSAIDGLRDTDADLLVEVTASPSGDGEPGVAHMREALERGVPVVTSNKWPVALHGVALAELASDRGVAFRAEATVISGTPVLGALVDGLAVATLVAEESPPSRVLEQVTEEVGRLLGLPGAAVVQYGGAHEATIVGGWSEDGRLRLPLATSVALDGDTVVAKVLRTGTAQRVERYDEASGSLAETLRSAGYRAAVAAPVKVAGRLWGALVAATASNERLPDGLERRLCDFADLVGQALANADARERLAASRAELVEASDAERRRLERNLHDGVQQRLVSVALGLGMVAPKLEDGSDDARALLSAARQDLALGLQELRELARGLHPVVLSERGLGAALDGLLTRSPLPVEIEELPEERLAAPVEAAAYYVVAETITNVAKYAHASRATVSIRRSNGYATVTVSDDGIGGADPDRGSGLRGLAARVEALNGRLEIDSPPQRGTRITAEIPCLGS